MSDQKFQNGVIIKGKIKLPNEASNRALQINGSGEVVPSAVTSTELGHVAGVTSAIQSQIDSKQSTSEKGQANGYASLDASGKVPVSQLPNAIMEYQGTYDASTNTPVLVNGAGNTDEAIGNVYRVSVAGSQDFGAGSISFEVGDYVILNSSKIWEKADATDSVTSVNGQQGAVVLDTDDINEGVANLYHTDERAQDAVGTILVDSASIDFTYDDNAPSITAVVLPAGVDHDALQNFVANEHVDHSTVEIATAAGTSGLTGGGDITATRNLSVDINGTTAVTSAEDSDELLIYDVSSSSLKKITRANLFGGAVGSAGDISETSFSLVNNQAVASAVTGLVFANGVVRSFKALVSVEINATTGLFESFELLGIQKGSSWDMSVSSTGDDSGIVFSITSTGQVEYTSASYSGFVSGLIKFRAETTSI